MLGIDHSHRLKTASFGPTSSPGSSTRHFSGVRLNPSDGLRNLLHVGPRPQQPVLREPNRFLAKLVVPRTLIALDPMLEGLSRVQLLVMAGIGQSEHITDPVQR